MKRLEVRQPILTNEDLDKIRSIGDMSDGHFHTITLDITFDVKNGNDGLEKALDRLCEKTTSKVKSGYNIIILSDRLTNANRVPIPALLATSAVHHHLIREGLRTSVGLVIETGEAREVHQFCTLAGFGAEAINPYLAFDTIEELRHSLNENISSKEASKRYIESSC